MSPESALQDTLAAEHAAMWVYAVLGGQTSASRSPSLFGLVAEGFDVHRARRDRLEATLRDLEVVPVAAAPAYEVPDRLGTDGAVRRLARDTERACAAAYAGLVADSAGDQRAWAIEVLTDAALRALRLQGIPETFPGAGELNR